MTQSLTGVQRYAIELSLKLRKMIDMEVIFIAPNNIIQTQLAEALNAKCVGRLTGHLWEQLELPFYLNKNDLLINFCNTAPLLHRKKLITVHDLAFLQKEKWHNWPFRMFYSLIIPLLLKTTRCIITVSQTSKNEIVSRFGMNSDNVHVIYNAVTENSEHFRTKQMNKNYILFVGSMDPRKNLERLISAFQLVETTGVNLKIVGGNEKSFKEIRFNESKNNQIEFLGRVDDETLFQLYSNAIAFIFPSLYEGFGLPPLEAIQKGCPVIGSDIEVFHEIYGDAMLYFDPRNEKSIADAIDLICSSEQLRTELIQKGQQLLKNYSFSISASKLVDLICSIYKK
ncbi:MAG: glycosyltransferase family 1 protein [Bacteroidota bacterium]|nr:glycosyltransferase family 1 protein [Bacteroidota bacterium]